MIPWRRERLPTPIFWSGEFHGLYSPWGCKESHMTMRFSLLAEITRPCLSRGCPCSWTLSCPVIYYFHWFWAALPPYFLGYPYLVSIISLQVSLLAPSTPMSGITVLKYILLSKGSRNTNLCLTTHCLVPSCDMFWIVSHRSITCSKFVKTNKYSGLPWWLRW